MAAYLAELDLSNFNPKAPPPKTEAFWEIVNLNRPPEDDELADALDKLGNPDATTIYMIADGSTQELHEWLIERKNRRAIPHRLRECGYVSVRNEHRKDGRWIIDGTRHVIYPKVDLPMRDRHVAATRLVEVETARLVEAERRAELVHVRPIRHRS